MFLPTRAISGILLALLLGGYSPSWAGVVCDGTDDLLTTSLDTAADCPNATCTVTMWAKLTAGVTEYFLNKSNSSNTGWRFGHTSNHLYVRISEADGGTAAEVQSTATINDGNWHHLAAVITTDTTTSANNVITLYVDGATGQGTTTRDGQGYGPNNDNVRFCQLVSGSNYCPCSIEDVRIYSGALSAQQILTLATGKLRGTQVGGTLIAYWPMDECSHGASVDGVGFRDLGGGGYTATADNGANNTGMSCDTTGAGLMNPGGVR